jgi:hypothetical protein
MTAALLPVARKKARLTSNKRIFALAPSRHAKTAETEVSAVFYREHSAISSQPKGNCSISNLQLAKGEIAETALELGNRSLHIFAL